MTLEDLGLFFENSRWVGGRLIVSCPVHDDRRPSLHLKEAEDGNLLMLCRAGCPTEEILAAVGLQWADLFVESRATLAYRPASPFPADPQAIRLTETFQAQSRAYNMDPIELCRARFSRFGEFLPMELDLLRARVIARLRGTPWTAARLAEVALSNDWDGTRLDRELECLPSELQDRVRGTVLSARFEARIQEIDR